MNKTFHSVWNASKQAYVAAAETVSANGKPTSGVKVAAIVVGLMGSLLSAVANAQTAPPPVALPSGGKVSAGQASISQSGASMLIHQGSERASINWQTFNVGKDAHVQFQQPSAASVTLNRVLSADPSQIFGRISANGQVILTNPAGVYFGKDARVDVGGLVATTMGMNDADFMAGKNRYERNGSTGSVVNEGELKAALGGYIALLAPEVRNQGAVIAQMGTVALAAGEAIDLKFDSHNRLTSLRVEPSQIAALVENKHAVQAPGGLVIISAQSMDRLVGSVVKNSGSLEANSLTAKGGRIVLEADHIALQSSSRIDASGATGGGTVLVGGDWQGGADPSLRATGEAIYQATTVTMAQGASIDASATDKGKGGTVVLWSDIRNANAITSAQGSISAQGGPNGGDGGRIETSGYRLHVDGLAVSTLAPQGTTGEWLLDPYNITIGTSTQNGVDASYSATADSAIINVNTLQTALSSSHVTVSTGTGGTQNGDITVASAVSSTSTNNLTLTAAGNIAINAPLALGGAFNANAGSTISLGADVTTGGAQQYTGNVTVSGTNVALSTLGNASSGHSMGFSGNINGATAHANNLYLISGTGAINVAGSVGNTTALGTLGLGYESVTQTPITQTFGYTGDFQSFTASSAGTYTLELWGAQGYRTVTAGTTGLGGYASGTYALTAGQTIRIYVGGQGKSTGAGGWNGGGAAGSSGTTNGGGGGGATDIRLGFNLSDRIIVAGGGGGQGGFSSDFTQYQGNAGPAGVAGSTAGTSYPGYGGGAGTGSAGGAGGAIYSGSFTVNTASPSSRTSGVGGGGGGGYYGGGGGGSGTIMNGTGSGVSGKLGTSGALGVGGKGGNAVTSSSARFAGNGGGGGGGSSYTGGVTNGVTKSGNETMPNPDGSTMTGKLGDGYAKISIAGGTSYNEGGQTGTITIGGSINASSLQTAASGFQLQIGQSAAGGTSSLGSDTTLNNTGGFVMGTAAHAHTLSVTGAFATAASGSAQLHGGVTTTNTQNYGADVVLLGNTSLTSTGASSVSGSVSGSGGLTQAGTGTLTLAGANTYSGATTVSAGTLKVTGSLADDTAVSVANGATYDVSASDTVGAISGAGNINLGSGFTLSAGGLNTNTTLSGSMSGAGAFTKTGTGTLTLSGANSHTGGTTVSAGTLALGASNVLPDTGGITVSGGTLDIGGYSDTAGAVSISSGAITGSIGVLTGSSYTSTDGGTISAVLGGNGALAKTGAGTLTLSADNTYGGTTTVSAGTLQVGAGGTAGTLGTGAVANNAALVFNRSDDVTVANAISGTGTLTKAGNNQLTLTSNGSYTGSTTIAGGTLVLQNNAPTTGSSVFNGPGALHITPSVASFSSAFSTSGWSFGSTLGGLALGKDGNTQNITIGSATSIAGPISVYGGNIAIDAPLITTGAMSGSVNSDRNTIVLKGTGNVTDGANGYVVATTTGSTDGVGRLLLLGGNVTLDNVANNDVYILSASGVGNLTFLDKAGLRIDSTLSPLTNTLVEGVSASGVVNIGTETAPLYVFKSVATTNASSTALTLNASKGSTVGGSLDANIIISGVSTNITVGTGGIGRLFTGSIADSTGLITLVGTGSRRFRYNADETTDFSAGGWTALGAGINAIYREQPSAAVTVNVENKSMTYGDAIPTLTGSVSGAVNGDSATYSITGRLNSSSGNIRVGSYTLTETGLAGMGYNVTVTNGTLTVGQKSLTLTGLRASDKTYNRETSASIASYGTLSGVVSGTVAGSQVTDAVTLVTSGASSTFSDYNAGTNKTVTLSGLSLNGGDAANYSIASQTTTATIHKAALTISGITASDKVYDASDAAMLVTSGLALGGLVAGDSSAVTLSNFSGTFESKNVGTDKTVTISYNKSNNAAWNNYSVTDQTDTTADITKATLTLAGATGVSKTYDGTTSTANLVLNGTSTPASAVGDLSGILGTDTVTLTGSAVFANADVARLGNAITGTVTTQAINQGTIALAGTDAGNYTLSWTSPGSGTIHPAPLTVYANNDAKFVSTADPTFSVSYAGFVAGQTASALATAPTVTVNRTNALSVVGETTPRTLGANGAELAGVYADALEPGSATAKNYSFNYVKGSYAIVPADQLLVGMAPVTTVYGTAASYAVSSAKYFGQTGAATARVSTVGGAGEITAVQVIIAADKFVVGDEVNVTSATGTGARLRVDSISGNGSIATLSVVSAGSGYAASDELNLQYSREVSVTSATSGNAVTLTDMGGQTAQFNLAPTAAALSTAGKLKAGNYQLGADGLVTETSSNFSNVVTVVGNHTVTPKALTTSVTAGAAKTYDGTRAMVGLTLGLTGIETGTNNDVVNASGTGTYDVDKNASTSKAYTVTGITLGGTDAGNYYLWDGTTATSTLTGTGAIGKRTLNVTYTGVDKVYDGNSTANVIASDDRVAGDKLTLAYQANFASMNSEAAKNVYRVAGVVTDKYINIASASLTGSDDDGNYTVAATGTATAAKITPASLVISGIVGMDKTYNRDATASFNTAGVTATGLMGSDTFGVTAAETVQLNATGAFGDVNAGLGKAVTITSSYTGTDAGNYTITSQTGTTASIAKRQVMVTASNGVSKTYDGTTDMTGVTIGLGAVNGVTESGLVNGDSVDVSGTGSFSSASVSRDANGAVLSDKTYTLSDLQLSGANAANYMIAGGATSVTGNNGRIDPKTLTLMGFEAASKVYDGITAATIISAGTLDGVVGADDVSASNTGATFSNKNVADGKTVTLNGITLGGLQAGNYSIAATATDTANISAKALTVSGLSSSNKVYDGTTTVTVNGTAALQSFQVTGTGNSSDGIAYIGDVVSVTGTAIGNFNSKDVATANTVAFSGLSLTGGDAGNYTLTQHANDNAPRITAKALTISGLSSSNKVYDGTTNAAVNGTAAFASEAAGSGSTSDGKAYTGDTVSLTGTAVGNFNSKDVATATTVAFTGLSLTGNDAGNYTLTQHANDNVPRIMPKALTISGLSSSNKVYDGTTAATVSGTAVLQIFQTAGSGNSSDGAAYTGDTVSLSGTAAGNFNSKNVADANTVAFTGLSLTGGDAGNYTLTQHANASQLITAKALTITANAVTKIYDGALGTAGATATVDTSALISGDVVHSAGTQAFTNKNVGTGKTVRASGVTINDASNADMTGNYDITYVDDTTSAITQLASATWVGGATGDWFNPANWASTSNLSVTGAVPDLANVATVVIPTGHGVNFSAAGSGLAESSQPVSITALQGNGATLNMSAGALQVGSSGITLGGLVQTGGDITIAGSVTVGHAFSQSAGTLSTTGAGSHISLTQATGDLAWSSISSSGSLIVDSAGKTNLGTTTVGGNLTSTTRGAGTAGGVTQTGALTVAGTAQFIAHTGTDQDALSNHASNDFQGTVSFTNANSGSWRHVTVVDANALTLGDITASGKLDATAATDLTVAGVVNVQSLDLQATSGDITQGANSTLTVTQGPSNLQAGDDITLGGINDFNGAVNANGNKITLKDINSLKLGEVTARGDVVVASNGSLDLGTLQTAGNLSVNSGNGDITQSGFANVIGSSSFIAGAGALTLLNPSNKFQKGTQVQASRYVIAGDTRKTTEEAIQRVQGSLPVSAPAGMGLSNASAPAPLVMSSAGGNSSSGAAPSGPAGGSTSGVTFDVQGVEQQATPAMVAVSLPKGAATSGTGFSFELPESVKSSTQGLANAQANLPSGAPLPTWLSFDAQGLRFEAKAVPDGAFPMQVVLRFGDQRIVVVISERTE